MTDNSIHIHSCSAEFNYNLMGDHVSSHVSGSNRLSGSMTSYYSRFAANVASSASVSQHLDNAPGSASVHTNNAASSASVAQHLDNAPGSASVHTSNAPDTSRVPATRLVPPMHTTTTPTAMFTTHGTSCKHTPLDQHGRPWPHFQDVGIEVTLSLIHI